MSGMSEQSERVAYIIGNGPSRKSVNREKLGQGAVYAANVRGMEMQPDVLHSNDAWIQYDIIKSGYRGKCHFLDFEPIPMEMPYEVIISGEIPADFDLVEHNPEHKANAVGWHFYCTASLDGWSDQQKESGYWREKRAYVCFVPDFMDITNIPNKETFQNRLPPSGYYLMKHAIESGHKRLEMYGFDSMAGEFTSMTTVDYRGIHGANAANFEQSLNKRFLWWYDKIMQENTDVEFIWHTAKAS